MKKAAASYRKAEELRTSGNKAGALATIEEDYKSVGSRNDRTRLVECCEKLIST